MITNYERQYMGILKDIYNNGFSDGVNERTGLATKRLPCVTIRVDLEKEFPVLKSKQVFTKTAEREILWIWQQMSNNVHDLKAKIWNEWADDAGSIGKAYGYQMAQPVKINEGSITDPIWCEYPNQTTFVLEHLKKYPFSRRVKTSLWNTADLPEMNLVPCVYGTDWNLDGGRLNLVLTQRSGDMPYGVPFNTTQYAMLQMMVANHLHVKPGILLHVIADAHIYENQMEGVAVQLKRYSYMETMEKSPRVYNTCFIKTRMQSGDSILKALDVDTPEQAIAFIERTLACTPRFVIDPEKSFWDMNVDNAHMQDYCSLGKIDFGDIAV